ncbi:MAG: hypothetical protein LUG98_08650 [Tannerellaceae bacterium]|nr:hypothetical protein [Tannerellaceae bacterium]
MNGIKLSVLLYNTMPDGRPDGTMEALQAATAGLDAEISIVNNLPEQEAGQVAATQGEYVLCMDSRIIVGEDTLRTLCCFLDDHPEAGVVGVKLLDGHGAYLPESRQTFPTGWGRFLRKAGIGRLTGTPVAGSAPEEITVCDIPSPSFRMFRRDNWEKAQEAPSQYEAAIPPVRLADQMKQQGFVNYYLPERVLFMKEEQRTYKQKQCRLLIMGYAKEFETVKQLAVSRLPDAEYVNLWDLGEERVMDAICRKNKMKNFTDIIFSYPDVRTEQILLFMDRMPEKKISYHIYSFKEKRLISAVR